MKKTITIFSVCIILYFAAVANEGHLYPNQGFVEKHINWPYLVENPNDDNFLFNHYHQSLEHLAIPNDLLPNHSHSQNLKSNIIFTHRLDSIIKYEYQDSDNPKEKTYYEYYQTGDSLRIISHRASWNSWTNSWYNSYTELLYDANGNRVVEISTVFNFKINQSFDDNNRLIEWSRFQWNSTEESWWGTLRYINTLNESGNLINRLVFSWSNELADWVYSYNQKFEWVEINGSMLNSSYLRENWNMESNEFQNSELHSYSYNEDGIYISYLRENWDIESASWKNNYKEDYTINEAGLRILSLSYDWDSTNQLWLPNSRIEREYDNLGKETKYLWQLFNPETDTFVNNRLSESLYNDMGNQIHFSSYDWDLNNEIWKGFWRTDSEFVNGNRVKQYNFSWDETNQDWMNGSMSEYIYDDVDAEKSSVIQWNRYSWNSEASEWSISTEESYTFNQDILPENLLSNDIYSEITLSIKRHKVIEEITYNNLNSGYFSQSVYYYTELENSTSVENIDSFDYRVFPNPANDHLTISGLKASGNIEIYDMQGKLLLNQKVNETETIEISALSPGLYIYRIFEEQTKIKTGKLVKQ